MSDLDLVQELRLSKAAAAEWLEKYRQAEVRTEAVWNLALHEVRSVLGHHVPRCVYQCFKCWAYDEIGKLLRGDPTNYVPVKERMRSKVVELKENCRLDPSRRRAYNKGMSDLMEIIEPMLAEKE